MQGVGDQGVHQLEACLLVVPGDAGFARIGVVVGPAVCGGHGVGAGHFADHPADRGDQLGHCVLGGHRVVQDRGVQRPAGLAVQHTSGIDHLADRVEEPVRTCGAGQSAPEVGQ